MTMDPSTRGTLPSNATKNAQAHADGLSADDTARLIVHLAADFEAAAERLGNADAIVGDGDHGVLMAGGFAAAAEHLRQQKQPSAPPVAAGTPLRQAGEAFLSRAGGASGPLFATLLLQLAAAADQNLLGVHELSRGIAAALERIQRLGRTQPGDKTLIDALQPAAQSLGKSAQQRASLSKATAAAARAARAGAEATIGMPARSGRARFIEGAGIGHTDPGALSVALFFETLHRVASEPG